METALAYRVRVLEHDSIELEASAKTRREQAMECKMGQLERGNALLAARVMVLEETLARYFAVLSQCDQHRDSIAAALDGPEAELSCDTAAYFLGRMQALCANS